jgi:DNA-binding transcriptional MerR regulator
MDDTLLPIGRFARATGLTVKALRHYDEVGLLRPAHVDDSSGYRYYEAAQVRTGETIRRLRSLEVPVSEIALVLTSDDKARREHLVTHGYRLHERYGDNLRAMLELDALVKAEEELVPDEPLAFDLVDEPGLRLAAVMRHARQDEMGDTVSHLLRTTRAWLREQDVEPVGAPVGVFRFGDVEGWHHLEIGWPVTATAALDDRLGVHAYPASRAASLEHLGYADAHETNQRFIAAVLRAGFEASQAIRMVYLSEERYRVVWPVR